MASVLGEYRAYSGVAELPTVEQMDAAYAHFDHCDPDRDIALIERAQPDGAATTTVRRWSAISATRGKTSGRGPATALFSRCASPISAVPCSSPWWTARNDTCSPGPPRSLRTMARDSPPTPAPANPRPPRRRGSKSSATPPTEWGASLVRPHLDDIPERSLPDGVEVRPVTPDQLRTILAADFEAFRGEWDFHEPTEEDYADVLESPYLDESLWKVAWAGDVVVGQVKTFINPDENAARDYRRGYTEYIATHRDWRNRGIAGALLAMSLRELAIAG